MTTNTSRSRAGAKAVLPTAVSSPLASGYRTRPPALRDRTHGAARRPARERLPRFIGAGGVEPGSWAPIAGSSDAAHAATAARGRSHGGGGSRSTRGGDVGAGTPSPVG